MTVSVAGIWELGYNVPISEAPFWAHPLRDFGVDDWNMAPVTGISGFKVIEWSDPEKMISAIADKTQLVFVTEDAETELAEFVHPESCCYVFGRSTWSPFKSLRAPGDLAVRLDTPTKLALSFSTSVIFAVLWHRGQQWR